MMQSAGYLAQQATGRAWETGMEHDQEAIDTCCTLLDGLGEIHLTREEFFREVQERALAILQANWPAVVAVASAFLKDHHLTGEQVMKILTETNTNQQEVPSQDTIVDE